MSSKVGSKKMAVKKKVGKKTKRKKALLSNEERRAWIMYDVACSPFFQVGTGIFFPFLVSFRW